MPREHSLSSRFDYLFEFLDVEESVPGADIADPSVEGAADVGGQFPSQGPQPGENGGGLLGGLL